MSHHENYRVVTLSVFVTVCNVTIDIPIACCLHSSFYSVLRSIKTDENTVIKKALDNLFSVRPLHNELTAVENERPAAPRLFI